MQRRRVALTGIGLLSPFGVGVEPFWNGLMERRSALRPPRSFPAEGLPGIHVGELPEFDAENYLDPQQSAFWSRLSKAAAVAGLLAMRDAGVEAPLGDRGGVILGTGYGCTYEFQETYRVWNERGWSRIKPVTVPRAMPNAPASQLAILAGARGINFTVSTACSSGAIAAGLAVQQIRAGAVDCCVTGGADVILNASTAAVWCALRVLSKRDDPTACRPFSADRDGLVLSEGCALFVLEELERARERGAPIYAEIAGVGATNDATNIVGPDREGEVRALHAALSDAGLRPDEIDYVCAHGTGTVINDANETAVLKEVFRERAPSMPVSSIKGHVGHAMGAAGALEIASTALALQRGRIPPTLHFTGGDPACDLDYVADGPRELALRTALTESFGFGGQNSALILVRPGAPEEG